MTSKESFDLNKELYRTMYYATGMLKQITKTYSSMDESQMGRYENLKTTKKH